VWTLTRKRSEAAFSLLVGLASAAIVLWGDQAGARLWVWHYLRWVSWPVRCGLALAILAVSLPAVQALLIRAWERLISARIDVGTRELGVDEALGLNCAWYADILLTLTSD